jgi:hypothetical protein
LDAVGGAALECEHGGGEHLARFPGAQGFIAEIPRGLARDSQSIEIRLDAEIEFGEIGEAVVGRGDGAIAEFPKEGGVLRVL